MRRLLSFITWSSQHKNKHACRLEMLRMHMRRHNNMYQRRWLAPMRRHELENAMKRGQTCRECQCLFPSSMLSLLVFRHGRILAVNPESVRNQHAREKWTSINKLVPGLRAHLVGPTDCTSMQIMKLRRQNYLGLATEFTDLVKAKCIGPHAGFA